MSYEKVWGKFCDAIDSIESREAEIEILMDALEKCLDIPEARAVAEEALKTVGYVGKIERNNHGERARQGS